MITWRYHGRVSRISRMKCAEIWRLPQFFKHFHISLKQPLLSVSLSSYPSLYRRSFFITLHVNIFGNLEADACMREMLHKIFRIQTFSNTYFNLFYKCHWTRNLISRCTNILVFFFSLITVYITSLIVNHS